MKRGILALIMGIFLIGLVSAQFLGGFGGYFDSSLFVYGGIFVVFFALLNFILGRTVFRENQGTKVVISLVLSLFAVYGIATSNFDVNMGSFDTGSFFLGDYLPTILTILFLAGIVYFIVRWGFGVVLMVLGILSIITSFTNLVYEKNIFLYIGIIFLVIGLLLQFRKPRIGSIPWQRSREPRRYRSPVIREREPRRYRPPVIREREPRRYRPPVIREREIRRRAKNISKIRRKRLARERRAMRRIRDANRRKRTKVARRRITRPDRLLPPHR